MQDEWLQSYHTVKKGGGDIPYRQDPRSRTLKEGVEDLLGSGGAVHQQSMDKLSATYMCADSHRIARAGWRSKWEATPK